MKCDHSTWNRCWRWLAVVAVALLMLIPTAQVEADAGPKPSMYFNIIYQVQGITLTSGELLICELADCSDARPLEQLGPQRLNCQQDSCSIYLYGTSPYYILRLTFSDKTRQSQVFAKQRYSAEYQVTVHQDDLVVKENTSILGRRGCFCTGLFTTVMLETVVAALLVGALGLARVVVGWVPLASLLTLPAVWFAFPLLPVSPLLSTGLAEGFAVLFEAGVIYLAVRHALPFRSVLLLSVVMNAASFLAGLLLM